MRVSFDLRSWALYVPFVSPSVHPLCLVSRRWGIFSFSFFIFYIFIFIYYCFFIFCRLNWYVGESDRHSVRKMKWKQKDSWRPFGLIMKVNKDWVLIGILWRKTTGVLWTPWLWDGWDGWIYLNTIDDLNQYSAKEIGLFKFNRTVKIKSNWLY